MAQGRRAARDLLVLLVVQSLRLGLDIPPAIEPVFGIAILELVDASQRPFHEGHVLEQAPVLVGQLRPAPTRVLERFPLPFRALGRLDGAHRVRVVVEEVVAPAWDRRRRGTGVEAMRSHEDAASRTCRQLYLL